MLGAGFGLGVGGGGGVGVGVRLGVLVARLPAQQHKGEVGTPHESPGAVALEKPAHAWLQVLVRRGLGGGAEEGGHLDVHLWPGRQRDQRLPCRLVVGRAAALQG